MRSVWRTHAGVAAIAASLWVVGASYGATAHSIGLAWWQIVLFASVVLAGSSEFVFISVVAAGGLPLVGALAGLLINTRNFSYGLSAGRYLPRGWRGVAAAHLVNDESVVYAATHADRRAARTAFFACGVGVAVAWPLGALCGSLLGRLVAPETFGLDAALPALMLALALPALRDRATAWSAAFGGAVALATAGFVAAGLPIAFALLGIPFGWLVTRHRITGFGESAEAEPAAEPEPVPELAGR